MSEIYVKITNAGTEVWRPVPAIKIGEQQYLLQGEDLLASLEGTEIWEFQPGTYVVAEEQIKSGDWGISTSCLIAVQKLTD